MVEFPFNTVMDAMVKCYAYDHNVQPLSRSNFSAKANNTASPCFVVDAIDHLKASGAELSSTEIDTIRNCAGVGYPGMSLTAS